MKSNQLAAKNQAHNPEMWVELYDNYLLRFAHSRIKNTEIAKDLVQDTFLAALSSLENFQHRASIKTWLTSILRNKIVDYYRTCHRELYIEDIDFDVISAAEVSGGRRRWSAWSNPVELDPGNAFEQMEFFEVLRCCLARLPVRLADVFIQHAWLGLSTEEICDGMSISKTNCWVMLHRARKTLRLSLQDDWIRA